jgi:beta-phosphoglucomutase
VGAMLKRTGLKKYFQTTLMVESITNFKPDPEIFLLAAKKLGVAPAKCVVVEDSVFGVRAAKSAGMGCVAVTTGVYSGLELKQEKPDLIVKTLKDPRIAPFILQ